MAETVVRYRSRTGQERSIDVRFLKPGQTFFLDAKRIEAGMAAHVEPRLLDLLEIAATVFAADTSFSRGKLEHPHHGENWRRNLEFSIAVREPQFWRKPAVVGALVDAVEFMSDDRVSFTFARSTAPPSLQRYFDFNLGEEDAFRVDDVIMFSGGLDSLAGTLETLDATDGPVALVTHLSAPKTISRQRQLIARLRQDYGARILWVPVRAHRKGTAATESTQRTRSLLFAALGFVVARMLGAERLQLYENGVVSQHLPFARPIVGTLATRTTHPLTLHNLNHLLSLVSEQPFQIRNGYELMTKAEVVQRLAEVGGAGLISDTVSCNQVHERSSDKQHCGACSQCLDRRFALLATGLGDRERESDYATDVLIGARDDARSKVLAVEWTRHALELASMESNRFLEKFGSELGRVIAGFSSMTGPAALTASHELHLSHGRSVRSALDGAFARYASDLVSGALPDSCLLRMMASDGKGDPVVIAPTARPPPEPLEEKSDRGSFDLYPLEVSFDPLEVRVREMAAFKGTKAEVLICLAGPYRSDRDARLPAEGCHYVPTGEIAAALGLTEEHVRQIVKRIRDELTEVWASMSDARRPEQLLIQSRRGGYRLDPAVREVS